MIYVYAWGNNPRRAELRGRRCVLEASGSMGTALVRFLDTGERVTTSRRALRRLTSSDGVGTIPGAGLGKVLAHESRLVVRPAPSVSFGVSREGGF